MRVSETNAFGVEFFVSIMWRTSSSCATRTWSRASSSSSLRFGCEVNLTRTRQQPAGGSQPDPGRGAFPIPACLSGDGLSKQMYRPGSRFVDSLALDLLQTRFRPSDRG